MTLGMIRCRILRSNFFGRTKRAFSSCGGLISNEGSFIERATQARVRVCDILRARILSRDGQSAVVKLKPDMGRSVLELRSCAIATVYPATR